MAITRYSGLLLILAFLLGSQSPHAQGVASTKKNPLADIKSLKCTFAASSTGNWKSDQPGAQVKPEDTVLEIGSIDTQEGTARIAGAVGDITALLTANSLHFLERSMLGSLTITTVFSRESPKGKFRAVRSQHDYLPIDILGIVTEPTVAQYYGVCEVVP